MNLEIEDKLANDLVCYAKDLDSYEYNDNYLSDEQAFEDMKKSLLTKEKVNNLIESLCNDINYFALENDLSNNDISDLAKRAFNLICKLNSYSKELSKEDKEVDI